MRNDFTRRGKRSCWERVKTISMNSFSEDQSSVILLRLTSNDFIRQGETSCRGIIEVSVGLALNGSQVDPFNQLFCSISSSKKGLHM